MDYVSYFKNRQGFDRLLNKLKQKYIKTGKFVGIIKLDNISEKEATDLSDFFGSFYFRTQDVIISLKKFNEIMSNSKYNDFDFKNLIDGYFGYNISTKSEDKKVKMTKEDLFFEDILMATEGISRKWLNDALKSRNEIYFLIKKRYNKGANRLKSDLYKTIACLDNLPNEEIYLPIFSSAYTKDPHFLDIDLMTSTLFISGLCYIQNRKFPISRSEKIDLYLSNKIIVDPLSNFVVTYNLFGNRLFDSFYDLKEPLIVSLYNINHINKIDTKLKKVFIFENPSILNILLQNNINVPVIITGGNPNYVVYKLLDKLVETGNMLYYNGDFDPEGLLIASKLKSRYLDKLCLFCYDLDDYNRCISKKKANLSRLKKLSKVDIEKLSVIKELLLTNHYLGYQESNIDAIINYINTNK